MQPHARLFFSKNLCVGPKELQKPLAKPFSRDLQAVAWELNETAIQVSFQRGLVAVKALFGGSLHTTPFKALSRGFAYNPLGIACNLHTTP